MDPSKNKPDAKATEGAQDDFELGMEAGDDPQGAAAPEQQQQPSQGPSTPTTASTTQQRRIDEHFPRLRPRTSSREATSGSECLDISPPDEVIDWAVSTEGGSTTGRSEAMEEEEATADDDDEITIVEARQGNSGRAAVKNKGKGKGADKDKGSKKKGKGRRLSESPVRIPADLADLLEQASCLRRRPLVFAERRLINMRRFVPGFFLNQVRDDVNNLITALRNGRSPRLPPTINFGREEQQHQQQQQQRNDGTPSRNSFSGGNATTLAPLGPARKDARECRNEKKRGRSAEFEDDDDINFVGTPSKRIDRRAPRSVAEAPSNPNPGPAKTLTLRETHPRDEEIENHENNRSPTDGRRRAILTVQGGNLTDAVWAALEARLEADIDTHKLEVLDCMRTGGRVIFTLQDQPSFLRLRGWLRQVRLSGRAFDIKWDSAGGQEMKG